ncbi:unnamed protein product [Strongylus vulgaris]|uniref:G-protein coupled receptors family 1 profile domain-containing protein n=1 Tax=Strongylus vulgaris TaxID=40348 RepID=A0A3P7IYI8_STRVU|nr:unnamed protein product [Strongylus vulgaris]
MLNDHNASAIIVSALLDESLAGTANGGISPAIADESSRPFMETLTLAGILLLLILFCVIGNLFVIVAIAWERDLRGRPQYYLIFSLAVADLVVSLNSSLIRAVITALPELQVAH